MVASESLFIDRLASIAEPVREELSRLTGGRLEALQILAADPTKSENKRGNSLILAKRPALLEKAIAIFTEFNVANPEQSPERTLIDRVPAEIVWKEKWSNTVALWRGGAIGENFQIVPKTTLPTEVEKPGEPSLDELLKRWRATLEFVYGGEGQILWLAQEHPFPRTSQSQIRVRSQPVNTTAVFAVVFGHDLPPELPRKLQDLLNSASFAAYQHVEDNSYRLALDRLGDLYSYRGLRGLASLIWENQSRKPRVLFNIGRKSRRPIAVEGPPGSLKLANAEFLIRTADSEAKITIVDSNVMPSIAKWEEFEALAKDAAKRQGDNDDLDVVIIDDIEECDRALQRTLLAELSLRVRTVPVMSPWICVTTGSVEQEVARGNLLAGFSKLIPAPLRFRLPTIHEFLRQHDHGSQAATLRQLLQTMEVHCRSCLSLPTSQLAWNDQHLDALLRRPWSRNFAELRDQILERLLQEQESGGEPAGSP